MCYYSRIPSRTGSRTSFLLLGRLSIGTVTCRQFSGRPCANSGRPRHSLHGKPAVFTAATSRFTAIMSQLSYHTRGNSKLQELFLYLSTNNFGKFHDSAVWELSCRTLLFYRIFAELSTAAVWISCARNDIPCFSLRFQGRGSQKSEKSTFPSLKSRCRQGISFLA